METLFLICAVVGGTLMLAQIVLGLLGFGGHGHGFGLDAGVDVDADLTHVGGHGDLAGHEAAGHDGAHHGQHQAHGSTWLFGILTFQTVVAAVTFFGLSGMAATRLEARGPLPAVWATGGGLAAMLLVHRMMRLLYDLRSDGTQQIHLAVGSEGTVYLSIPGDRRGSGKIHLSLQERLVEYEAITAGPPLPGGAKIVVTAVAGPDTVEVALAEEQAESPA